MIGQTLGPYLVVDKLGEGGMGEVYLVEDTRLHRRAALKLVSPALTRDETRRQRFLQEARLAASIDHPHIAAVYDIGEFDGRTYIVMEYVAGRSLRAVLRAGPLKLRQALDYALEAAEALAKVHERGVIHRDLKPENLLIAGDGYLKIIDFGLAKLADPLARSGLADAATVADDRVRTADGVVMGTIGYMPPEQVRGEAVDARSDIFSFGAVFYEMVTGVAPFKRKSPAETITAILLEAPALQLEDAAGGPELERIFRKSMAKDAASRYQSMRDLIVDLRDLRNTVASSAPMPRLAQASVTPPRSLARRAAAAAVAALVAGLIAWVAWRKPAPTDAVASRPTLAIVPFEVISGGQNATWLGKGLPSMLITGLAQTPDIALIGSERLGDAAREVGARNIDAVERSQLAGLARRAGARFVLNGTIVEAANELRIDARVEDLETGAVRLAETVRGSDTLAIADDLAARVRRGFDVDAGAGAVRRLADVSTSSIEAYRAYIAGVEAELNLRLADAQRLFQEAVHLDPAFGLAYYHLAIVNEFEGRITESRRWMQQAAAHMDRMSERDATMVRAELARAEGRFDEADRLLEGLVGRYPETEAAWLKLGFPFFAYDPEKARTTFERAVTALPQSPGMLNMLGYGQLVTDRPDAALRSFEGYVKLRPSEGNALDSLAEGYLVSGRSVEALSTYEAAVIRGYADALSGTALALGVVGRFDDALARAPVNNTHRALLLSRVGRYREARLALEAEKRQYQSNGWIEGIASIHLSTATYALEQGRCEEAKRDTSAIEDILRPRPLTTTSTLARLRGPRSRRLRGTRRPNRRRTAPARSRPAAPSTDVRARALVVRRARGRDRAVARRPRRRVQGVRGRDAEWPHVLGSAVALLYGVMAGQQPDPA